MASASCTSSAQLSLVLCDDASSLWIIASASARHVHLALSACGPVCLTPARSGTQYPRSVGEGSSETPPRPPTLTHKSRPTHPHPPPAGSAISSIDPVATLAVLTDTDVPPMLYNLVFGESVLNDAVAIVLFRSLAKFYDTPMGLSSLLGVLVSFVALALGSLAIGVAVALAAAFLLKRLERPAAGRSHVDGTLYEIAIVVMGSYLAYLLAELAGMSGIVALFFSGLDCYSTFAFCGGEGGRRGAGGYRCQGPSLENDPGVPRGVIGITSLGPATRMSTPCSTMLPPHNPRAQHRPTK